MPAGTREAAAKAVMVMTRDAHVRVGMLRAFRVAVARQVPLAAWAPKLSERWMLLFRIASGQGWMSARRCGNRWVGGPMVSPTAGALLTLALTERVLWSTVSVR